MPNIEAKITNHNKAILANSGRISNDESNQCNCRKKSVIYALLKSIL